tara:strand:+ start:1004 stop:1816 length:813 start_codon:yes stop_codon:yes gene_type:complete
MGIINEHRKTNDRFGMYQEPVKEEIDTKSQKILDLTYMKKLIGDVLKYHKTKVPLKELKGYRRWSYVQQWRLQNLLGHVDTPTFVFMLESSVDWCVDTRGAVQPNGKWELLDFEIKVEQVDKSRNQVVGRDRDGNVQTQKITEAVQYLVIGFQFVDVKGNKDLQYEMGRPKAYSDQSITPDMLREILANQGTKVVDAAPDGQDDKYKEVIEKQQVRIAEQDASLLEMKEQMSTMQDMVAGLITELQTARNSDIVEKTPTAKKTPVKKRGK